MESVAHEVSNLRMGSLDVHGNCHELKRGALDTVERQFSLLNARTVRICNTLKTPPAPDTRIYANIPSLLVK